jgi:hypothetical protein
MKRLIRAVVLASLLAMTVATSALASGLSGTYKTTISGVLGGTYRITFTPGHWKVTGPITSHGTDRISGSRITIHGTGPCKSAGTYSFKKTKRTVKFTTIHDPCFRASLISANTWKKV